MEPLENVAQYLVASDDRETRGQSLNVCIAKISGSRELDLDIVIPAERDIDGHVKLDAEGKPIPVKFHNLSDKDIFEYEILEKAYLINVEDEMISHDTTQQVSKNLNIESKVILGSELNLKITYKEDLEAIKLKLEEYGNKWVY